MERSCLLRAWVDEIEAVPLMDGMMVIYVIANLCLNLNNEAQLLDDHHL